MDTYGSMEKKCILLLALFWILIVIDCAVTDLEVKRTPKNGLDPKSPLISSHKNITNEKIDGLESTRDSNKFNQVQKGKDQTAQTEEGVVRNKLNGTNSSNQLGSQEGHKVQMDKDGSVTEGDKKEKPGEGFKSKDVPKEEISLPETKENYHGKDCDPSNSCTDKKSTLVACLRVPGNESPDLLLLIQNKGKDPLSVTISAPDFVQLEKTKIQLPEKEDKKVKVSIRNGGPGNVIVLTAGNGNCNLNFGDLLVHNSRKETDYTSKSMYINLLKRTPVAVVFFAAMLVASAWLCVSLHRRHFASSGSKYQKLDMELPVSTGRKIESNLDHDWDNSWGDNWDDEEAPKTPSMPVTPSLSAKGLAPRRLNKEGWKD